MDMIIIEREALLLSDSQRALLVDRLIASLSSSTRVYRETWIKELNSRMNAYQEGKIEALEGELVMQKLRKKVAQ